MRVSNFDNFIIFMYTMKFRNGYEAWVEIWTIVTTATSKSNGNITLLMYRIRSVLLLVMMRPFSMKLVLKLMNISDMRMTMRNGSVTLLP